MFTSILQLHLSFTGKSKTLKMSCMDNYKIEVDILRQWWTRCNYPMLCLVLDQYQLFSSFQMESSQRTTHMYYSSSYSMPCLTYIYNMYLIPSQDYIYIQIQIYIDIIYIYIYSQFIAFPQIYQLFIFYHSLEHCIIFHHIPITFNRI